MHECWRDRLVTLRTEIQCDWQRMDTWVVRVNTPAELREIIERARTAELLCTDH